MFNLLVSTLEMMGLTFVIGFFVAFIIKLIAGIADSLDFYSLHQKELTRLRRLRKLRRKLEFMVQDFPVEENEYYSDKREEFSRGLNHELTGYRGYYHGVSSGVGNKDLMDYYYDTHLMYLKEREEMIQNKNKKETKK